VADAYEAARYKMLVDGAQSVFHLRVNVQALDAAFFVFSCHKIFGPARIGVAWGKNALLEQIPPCQGGGKEKAGGDTGFFLPADFVIG